MSSKAKLYSLLLLVYTAILILLVFTRTRDHYDKPPITNTVKVEVPFPVDSSAIISKATEGMVPYESQNHNETSEILGKANAEIIKLQTFIDSLRAMAANDSSGGGGIDILLPSLGKDTTVVWTGTDSSSMTDWSVSVRDSTTIIPLLGEIRSYYSMDMNIQFKEQDAMYVYPKRAWWEWFLYGAGAGAVIWEFAR